jgi:hypothetical protein
MRNWSKKSAMNIAKSVAICLVMEKRCENKVEMCHFLGCNGSIIRHYIGCLINVEEPEKSLKGWVSCRLYDPPPPLKLPNLTALLFGTDHRH